MLEKAGSQAYLATMPMPEPTPSGYFPVLRIVARSGGFACALGLGLLQ